MKITVKSSVVLKAGTTAGLIKLITILVITMSLIWSPAPANAGFLKPLSIVLKKGARVIWTPAKKLGSTTRSFSKTGAPRAVLGYDEAVRRYNEQLQLARTGLSEDEGTIQLDPIVSPEPRRKKNTYSLLDDELERTIHSESSSSSWTMQMSRSIEDILLHKERRAEFYLCAQGTLSESLFPTFYLKYYRGYSYEKISRTLYISEGTVASRLSEARKKVKSRCAGIL